MGGGGRGGFTRPGDARVGQPEAAPLATGRVVGAERIGHDRTLIHRLRSLGRTIFFVSHHRNQVATVCDRVLWLERGYLQGDDTDAHIDTLARFAPNDAIVFQNCDDATDARMHALAKAAGVPYLLDATQSVGQLPLDVGVVGFYLPSISAVMLPRVDRAGVMVDFGTALEVMRTSASVGSSRAASSTSCTDTRRVPS